MNELPNQTSKARAKEFVDDVTIIAGGKTPEELQEILQLNLDKMGDYLTNNRMVINKGKSQLMILTKDKNYLGSA